MSSKTTHRQLAIVESILKKLDSIESEIAGIKHDVVPTAMDHLMELQETLEDIAADFELEMDES